MTNAYRTRRSELSDAIGVYNCNILNNEAEVKLYFFLKLRSEARRCHEIPHKHPRILFLGL